MPDAAENASDHITYSSSEEVVDDEECGDIVVAPAKELKHKNKKAVGSMGLLKISLTKSMHRAPQQNRLSKIECQIQRFFVDLAKKLEKMKGVDLTEKGDELMGHALCAFAGGDISVDNDDDKSSCSESETKKNGSAKKVFSSESDSEKDEYDSKLVGTSSSASDDSEDDYDSSSSGDCSEEEEEDEEEEEGDKKRKNSEQPLLDETVEAKRPRQAD